MDRIENAPTSLLDKQAEWLANYQPGLRIAEQGTVVSVGDGISWIKGLPSAAIEDILDFADGSRGMVFDLNRDRIGAILLYETEALTAGTTVHLSRHSLSIPVGDEFLGRIIDPLGTPLDGQLPPVQTARESMEKGSPPIITRDFVHKPLYTGIKIIDTLIPIGKGQRQLIVGDEGLGRTSIAIDTVVNQKGKNVLCIYVLIGQKRSAVVNTIETLKNHGALDYTVCVVAEASTLPGLQYIAPFAGCALAEYWMAQGRDTLIIYDDLSTHARTYRELSLLLRRPPGREAYPGDIFFVHSRLLERSTSLNAENGGGSMTALPIIETKQGEIAAYIPTNLISITDGQIYLDNDLFVSGFRPAIDITRSVSRIGGKAQDMSIRDQAGQMKLDYLQFLELEVFTRFGQRLEASMEARIKRGRLLREILKQDRLTPLSNLFQLAWLTAFNAGLFNQAVPEDIPKMLASIDENINSTALTLDSSPEQWQQAVNEWLNTKAELSGWSAQTKLMPFGYKTL
ncbi:F0F1 ATP synthase subunit alpha [Candidatus Methylobacter oryzae]|uniref:ATP synthase subunit alpha n=1 Tax=Candidatus Methylobacter oryzae TaxID=2497749 RepID=A0ABY3CGU9_9GAMM|nr:F0F1 ATP synthase subunit alpha [Candidatus Methylobacter oryzae]TRX03013.1 F0F1 ATP synthase subunit alpha [Candidatus Methylobacter oryzae]